MYFQVPLLHQKLGQSVLWDYHVIFIYSSEDISLVYDFDTTLPFPCQFNQYYENVFVEGLDRPELRYLFRVVKARDYLNHFTSDRSRMRNSDGSFMEPPPNYPCIQVPNKVNNLNSFISMNKDQFNVGDVLELKQFADKFSK